MKSSRILRLALLLLIVLVGGTAWAEADLRLPAAIGDHMVLQRDTEVPLWGWAEPGATVTASFADKTYTTEADASGKWMMRLNPMQAGGPYDVIITSGESRRVLENVLVGEVWLCSGQSNMDMRLRKMANAESEIAGAIHPNIRLLRVERAVADSPQNDCEGQWMACSPEQAKDFSAVAYYFGLELQDRLDVPIGLIHTAYGGTPAEAWTRHEALQTQDDLTPILERWDRRVTDYESALAAYEEADGTERQVPTPPTARYAPSDLYNAMIHPLIPYAIRGAVWYQGESNIWRATQYRPLLTAMINDWRDQWGQERLPFGIVQLASYANPPRVPAGVYSWEELRESQMLTAHDLPDTGLVVTIDIGNPTDIHPLEKREIGRRLGLWAMATAYGQDIVSSGPMFREAEIIDDKVYLTFDHVGSGLESHNSDQLRGFVIAGPDQKFRWAVAEIEGDRIVVSEKKVTQPVAVRYAWDDNPDWANLINREGLPASPFRTDDWPSITQDNR